MRCAAVAFAPDGTSSRDTRALRAPTLNTTGMYSIVRHPLYLGAGLMWVGIAMSLGVWWLVAIVAMAYWLYVERLMVVEEAFLAETFPVEFPRWASRTRAFLPRPSDWTPSTGRLQCKRLSSEHNGAADDRHRVSAAAVPREPAGRRPIVASLVGAACRLDDCCSRSRVATSVVCILLRRLPPASTEPSESDARSGY